MSKLKEGHFQFTWDDIELFWYITNCLRNGRITHEKDGAPIHPVFIERASILEPVLYEGLKDLAGEEWTTFRDRS